MSTTTQERDLERNLIAMTNACIRSDAAVSARNISQTCTDCFVNQETCCKNNADCLAACVLLFDTHEKCDAAKQKASCITPVFTCTGMLSPF